MQEIWKDIKNYEGLYQISNLGKIKSLERKVKNQKGNRTVKEIILKCSEGKSYVQVTLSKKNNYKTKLVHRLVAEAFIPNPNNLSEVNHIDGNKHNNNVNNLEWVSRYDNMQHAKKLGLINTLKGNKSYWYNKYGIEHSRSKKIVQIEKNNKKVIKIWNSLADVKRELGIHQSNICKCCEGKRKTTGGYIWKYYQS